MMQECQNCSLLSREESNYCPYCGKKLMKQDEYQNLVKGIREYVKEVRENSDKLLNNEKISNMHLLDAVSEKLIRTHSKRLQSFVNYMEDAWKYEKMIKGEIGYQNVMYTIHSFINDVDMVIGIRYTNELGKRMIGWKESTVMYTEQAIGMLVRMKTPEGKKIVSIPFGTAFLHEIQMVDDQPANNRKEWYEALQGKWMRYPRKKIPSIPIPYNSINVCSHPISKIMMFKNNLNSDNYKLPWRPEKTVADLYYQPEGYKLHPNETTVSIYYNMDNSIKLAVDYLQDIQIFTLSQDGIIYIKGRNLYYRDQNNAIRKYEDSCIDCDNCVRIHVSDNFIFMDIVDKYIKGDSYDACGDTMYYTNFSVKYRTDVINRSTGKCVAKWKDMPEITHVFQWQKSITVATGDIWYTIEDSEEGISSLVDPFTRQKIGKKELSKEYIGQKHSDLIQKYGIENFVGLTKENKLMMIVDDDLKEF